jgi:saccharopine dehydrogenase (NAD+, L-lysine-forming)
MHSVKIGIIREGKVPPDRRVAFLPHQLKALSDRYPQLHVTIEHSDIRCVADIEYQNLGLTVSKDLTDSNILFGIKEVPISQLQEGKTYFFFSHTIKKQAYNRSLLQEIMKKKIRLIDYECLTDAEGNRLVAFGRFAGIVGAYNALWTWGKRTGQFDLPRAFTCRDMTELHKAIRSLPLPPIKFAITGGGRVSNGAIEIMEKAGITRVGVDELISKSYPYPVYAQLRSADYYIPKQGETDFKEFYSNPELFRSSFSKFYGVVDVLIHCAFWDHRADILFSQEEMAYDEFKIKVIADITCDINGSIPSTTQPSTIADPVYDYDPLSRELGTAFSHEQHINVMAIDNLPTELPYDASAEFGEMLGKHVIPALISGDEEKLIERATITEKGDLTARFKYLEDYVSETV